MPLTEQAPEAAPTVPPGMHVVTDHAAAVAVLTEPDPVLRCDA